MKSANCSLSLHNFNKHNAFESLKRKKLLNAFSSNYKIKPKSYKILVLNRYNSDETGKVISSGERKIILNVFKHFK